MWNFVIKGGPVMAPIILGSIIGLAIILEKWWSLGRVKLDLEGFAQEAFKKVRSHKIEEALALCRKHRNHPLAVVFETGIERRDIPAGRLEKIMEQKGSNQIQRLERRLGGLASIVGIEPLLGFLGTITGLIRAFMSWEQAGANITVTALAGGIYEAMITTAAGLIIAIPCYLFYNYFVSRIKYITQDVNNYASALLEIFQETHERSGGKP
jgi:biopolymer transport protein ExbB